MNNVIKDLTDKFGVILYFSYCLRVACIRPCFSAFKQKRINICFKKSFVLSQEAGHCLGLFSAADEHRFIALSIGVENAVCGINLRKNCSVHGHTCHPVQCGSFMWFK